LPQFNAAFAYIMSRTVSAFLAAMVRCGNSCDCRVFRRFDSQESGGDAFLSETGVQLARE
jgi:hypothetical protein